MIQMKGSLGGRITLNQFITEVLPHRRPFLFVDEIIEQEYEKIVIGKKTIKEDEFWVEGHFPGNPIFPGVLILETMAQVGGFLFFERKQQQTAKRSTFSYLTRVDNLKLKRKVIVNDEIIIIAKLISKEKHLAKVFVQAKVKDKKVAEAIIGYAFLDVL
ncbi:TPA: beta-hydroxyacyl-ACP dehydratase [Enterococcus faecalis]|nr:beta-hydroxyacyl-ACP dehydratase [Enterococcus faecalis]HAP5682658.1 beta-hydroxyacyl-ACP dehydratase [Enterococcus faecalis]